jgi:cytochrome P450
MARQLAGDLVAGLGTGVAVDLVRDLAVKVPVVVMSRLLRLAPSEYATVKRWSREVTAAIGNPEADDVALTQVLVSRREMELVFGRLLAEARLDPDDDLVTAVAQAGGEADIDTAAEAEDPGADDWLSESERCGLLINFLVAGNESTAKLIAACLRLLGEDREQFDDLQHQPELVVPFVEEVLRLEPPTQGMFRHLEHELEIGGEVLPAGCDVFLVYAAGNRDPEAFAEPDELRLDRPNGNRHLSFGHGIHLCLGAGLARMEARVTLEVVLEQLASITLTEDNTFDHEPTYLLHGLQALHAVLERRADTADVPMAAPIAG